MGWYGWDGTNGVVWVGWYGWDGTNGAFAPGVTGLRRQIQQLRRIFNYFVEFARTC